MNDNPGRSAGQSPDSTATDGSRVETINTPGYYRRRAATIRGIGAIADDIAEHVRTAFNDLSGEGSDLGSRLALHLRECARECAWTATRVELWADEAEQAEVGRLDSERPPNFSVIAGGAA